MRLSRRSLIAAGAALPFLRAPARAATMPGKLVFGLSSYPPNLFPFANAGTAAATAKLAMFRGLLGYDPEGKLRGELAESWERDPKDGAWVFHLRQAVFHNGDPVTSADVAYTIEQVANPKSTAYLRTEMQNISRVETPDPRTVRLVTAQPVATLPLLMASFYLPICAKGSADNNGLGIGAGPFVPVSQERGVALEFKAFDKYYRPGHPKVQSLRMVAYQDENLRVAALQTGDVDLIEYVPWQSMATIEQDQKLALQSTNGPFMYLIFNGKAGPFGDARVRRAIAHAIRREEIVKAAFFGRGAPIEGIPIAESSPFYDDKRAHGWPYDAAKAKALLKEAGHADGFSAKLLATAQYGMHKDTASLVQQHLAEIGVQVELVLPDWATRVNLGNRGQFEFAVGGTAADSNDPDGLSPLLASNSAPSYVRSVGIDTPELDKLLAEGRAEFDAAKRKAIYDKMQDVALAEATLVGLCWRSQGYGMSRKVQGFHNMPGALTFYSGTTFEDVDIA
ncbi:MAG TPA: ABC transporter substrate-binding protein [Stellaceae bacterium]|nr:ABC transporter substrate-binding protein [Stellaceae bacterium]